LQTKIILLLLPLFYFVRSLKQILFHKIPNHVKLTCDSQQEKEIKTKRGNMVFPLPSTCSVFKKRGIFVCSQIGYILYENM
jgi:hypothetical protein